MKTYEEMAASARKRIDDHNVKQAKRRRAVKQAVVPVVGLCLVAALGFGVLKSGWFQQAPEQMPENTPAASVEQADVLEENNETPLSLDEVWKNTGGNTWVFASYSGRCDSIDALLETATLIVRATPVSIESESSIALCWVLQVTESNQESPGEIRLRQLKDQHLLKLDQEVVLALQPDSGEGYYNIPGGGCGLFRIDKGTGAVRGALLDSLLEQTSFADSSDAITLERVFDMLIELSQ